MSYRAPIFYLAASMKMNRDLERRRLLRRRLGEKLLKSKGYPAKLKKIQNGASSFTQTVFSEVWRVICFSENIIDREKASAYS